ncbi:MAG: PorT family protein [Bacteroidetes bacterium]|uniref:PorT family protein n=1 Tax=Candidatus Cryptobacteroides merdavium TaxID=2840769 RepID=A0A9D9EEV6_9BACT|nr:PorT family protein [Candidatus Cryptobacteroides merdavium]
MKKTIASASIIIAILLVFSISAKGQSRFGVIGGFSFSHASDIGNRGTTTKYNVGVTYQLKLPMGFSIQPSLMYHVKGARVGEIGGIPGSSFDLTAGYLELPVSFQWGPDLLLFRPFLDVSPYIGVGLNNSLEYGAGGTMFEHANIWKSAGLARMEYGLGLGIGIEIWRFQVIGRYNWNFGSLYKAKDNMDTSAALFTEGAFNGGNFRGLTLSLSFLF